MKKERYIVTSKQLDSIIDDIIRSGKKLVAPVKHEDAVTFEKIGQRAEMATDYIQTTFSAKDVVFPRFEKVFGYKNSKEGVELQDFDYNKIPDTVVWGTRSCDAAGFSVLDAIFNWDIKDAIYNKHREKTTIVSFGCNRADEYCFCTSVNGSPGNTQGSDAFITYIGNEQFVLELITEKGQSLFNAYSNQFIKDESLADSKEERLAKLDKVFDEQTIKNNLDRFFESAFWAEQSLRCLGCGACAYVCPSCACFDIVDDKHGNAGSRLRCWDSCGFSIFTLHTSGHNPRNAQPQRWRQRLMHKFSYMPDRLTLVGCTGCGRCSRACPVDMNLLEHLTSIMNLNKKDDDEQ
jgi:sulfhydrogenase subunit beta (sulfur reductase)